MMDSSETQTGPAGKHTRRELLRRAALLAGGVGVGTPIALHLAGRSNDGPEGLSSLSRTDADPAADAPTEPTPDTTPAAVVADESYRALVCVFLYGGNDHNATFVPYDEESFSVYQRLRGELAPDRGDVHRLGVADEAGRELAFAPEWAALRLIYEAGDLAVVSNVGTLKAPTTKRSYGAAVNRPDQLFSHNDQQTLWQSTQVDYGAEGWGGRLADVLLDANGDNAVFTAISTAGVATMMTGRDAGQYHVSAGGVTELISPFRANPILDGLRSVMGRSTGGVIADAYTDVTRGALQSSERLAASLPEFTAGVFPESRLGEQLAMVTRLIAAGRDDLGLKRQVFFVAAGGFDTHARHSEIHPLLLADFAGSLSAFRGALSEIDASDSVTTFTASDFGRTLNSNGDGTDHGWGSHHIVMGGAVDGGRVIGRLPVIADDGPDDVGRGRLIPTIAVDQYAATLGRWMGAGDEGIRAVAPNLDRFDSADLGLFTR